jgi:hypothetical protein
MKFKLEKQRGSILTMILVTIILIGITLGSYLHLVSNQNQAVIRSQQWNAGIPLAEAGIEEAMAHLNKNTTNRSVDGWVTEGTNVVKERYLGKDKYRVMVNKDANPPLIVSEGYVYIPAKDKYIDPPRRVRVTTTNDALFTKAMVAKGTIELAGNRIRTDSFDSSDPAYSNGGKYHKDKNKDNGDVATNSSVIDSLDAWNAEVWGHVATGPGGTVKIGPNGAIGDRAWHVLGKKGIKAGWASDDMNVQFPDVAAPGGTFAGSIYADKVGDTNYVHVVESGSFEMNSLSMSGNQAMLIKGNAVLYIKGDVDIKGNAYIYIQPGASLNLYVGGTTASIGGNGVANADGKAVSFAYWGLNSNKALSMHGNAAFIGTIYAPHADLTLGGGGSDEYDFIGASISSTVKMNGKFNFHYDEALGKYGPRRGYTITSWTEAGWPNS